MVTFGVGAQVGAGVGVQVGGRVGFLSPTSQHHDTKVGVAPQAPEGKFSFARESAGN